jgi:hypothetical protein
MKKTKRRESSVTKGLRNVNQEFGYKNEERITRSMQAEYVANAKPGMIREMAKCIHLPFTQFVAKIQAKFPEVDERRCRQFRSYTTRWINGTQKTRASYVKKTKATKIVAVAKVADSNDTYKSAGKTSIKEKIVGFLTDKLSPKTGEVLTLAHEFAFELELIKLKVLAGLNFAISEVVVSTLKKQVKMLKNNDGLRKRVSLGRPMACDFNDLIYSGAKNRWAHIFADYCGQFRQDIRATLNYMITNDLVQKYGIIWLTLDKRSVHGVKDLDTLIPTLVKDWGNERYKVEFIESYKGTLTDPTKGNTGSNMITFIIRRIK